MKKGTIEYNKACAKLALKRLKEMKDFKVSIPLLLDIVDSLRDIIEDDDEMMDVIEHEVEQ